jgi:hypothetical protein
MSVFKILLSLTIACLVVACQAEQTTPAVHAERLQNLADAACLCNRKAEHGSAYNSDALSPCWQKFDAALQQNSWSYQSVAADGPISSAGICVGGDFNAPDACVGGAIFWVSRTLGACSQREQDDRIRGFEACLKKTGGDEITCANGL